MIILYESAGWLFLLAYYCHQNLSPALNQLSISSKSLFFARRDQESTIMGFFSPLHSKIGRLSSSFYSDFRKAFLFYF